MKKELTAELMITAELCCWAVSKQAWKAIINRLDREKEEFVEKALIACREKMFIDRNPLAAILEQVKIAESARPRKIMEPPVPMRPKPEWMGK
jgi:hypothetical protein